jgi:nitric oxide reductase subunit B
LLLQNLLATEKYNLPFEKITNDQKTSIIADVQSILHMNRYDTSTGTLTFSAAEATAFQQEVRNWTSFFTKPDQAAGLPQNFISDPSEIRNLTTFFSWSAWASVAYRPSKDYSYTNNWPYDKQAGNAPTSSAIIWSALSLILLLGMTGLILFIFGKFDYLGWKSGFTDHPIIVNNFPPTESQKVVFSAGFGRRSYSSLPCRTFWLLRIWAGKNSTI